MMTRTRANGSENMDNGIAPSKSGDLVLSYFLPYYIFNDFYELRNKASALYLQGRMNQQVQRLLQAKLFTDLLPGNYQVRVQYLLPGIRKVTSEKQVDLRF